MGEKGCGGRAGPEWTVTGWRVDGEEEGRLGGGVSSGSESWRRAAIGDGVRSSRLEA